MGSNAIRREQEARRNSPSAMTMLQVNDLCMFMGRKLGTKLGMGFGRKPFPQMHTPRSDNPQGYPR